MRKSLPYTKSAGYASKLLFFLSIMITGTGSIAAQDRNGSVPGSGFINLIISNRILEEQIQVDTVDPQLNVTLSIRPFVVNREDGQSYFEPESLDSGLAKANQYFSNIGIQFKTEELQIIPEYEYGTITHRDSTLEMEVKYARGDYIDLFLVESIMLEESPCFGYTFFPDDSLRSVIFLCRTNASGNYLTTLLGNFFGLLCTHEKSGGIERADQSNCRDAGDYICDTWADPGLSGTVGDDCLYTGSFMDPAGGFYVPSVANLMSDGNDLCKCLFSMEQYRRMKFYYLNYRRNLR